MTIDVEAEVLLVVVGAGASYDCLGEVWQGSRQITVRPDVVRTASDVRPPLTKDLARPCLLYNELALRYPAARPLIDEIRERLGEKGDATLTLEQALAEYQARRASDPAIGKHLMAMRFYLRDLIAEATKAACCADMSGGLTNYQTLVRRCRRWAMGDDRHVCFVSFNYDTLLDQACQDVWGLRIKDLDSYTADAKCSLLKPHGSIAWAWQLEDARVGSFGSDRAKFAIERGEPEDTNGLRPLSATPDDMLGPVQIPALALPMAGKSGFVWPSDQEAHFRSLQSHVRRVLTIGWRGAEPHFTELLRDKIMARARINLVHGGPHNDQDVRYEKGELAYSISNTTDLQVFGNGFTHYLGSTALDRLLEPIAWPGP